MLKTILLGVGVFAALFAILIFSGKIPLGTGSKSVPQGDVIVWGTVPQSKMDYILQTYNASAKTYRVIYSEIREESFNQTLLEALASGKGPDMILAPQQIILSQSSRLYAFPVTSFPEKDYKDMYVDGASIFFTPSGAVAFPVSIEPMVLFYNRTLFSKHGIINPPAYWDEVTNIVPTLTLKDNRGLFIESGIDLGSPSTPYAKDIMMAIVSQLGQTPVLKQYSQDGKAYYNVLANSPVTEGGDIRPLSTVARFFTQFGDPTKDTYSWNQYSGKEDDQFVAEKLAMYIGYSGEFGGLRARNPRGDFGMAYLPQTRGYNTFATGAKIYGIAILASSKNLTASFAVQNSFGGIDLSSKVAGAVGGVPALRAYAGTAGLDPVIARSMLVARGWIDPFFRESSTYMSTMISDILNNKQGPNDAASIFVSRLQDLYSR